MSSSHAQIPLCNSKEGNYVRSTNAVPFRGGAIREIEKMKRITALLASVVLALPPLVGAPGTAEATTHPYHAFCPGGLPSIGELTTRMTESLRLDSTGHRPLRGCVANPIQFLAAFRQGDPESEHLGDFAQMLRFLREDVERFEVDHSIEYYSSCVRGHSREADDVFMQCQPQRIAAGVQVFRDRITGRIVVKLDCVNPGLSPVAPPPCAFVVFRTTADDDVVNVGAMAATDITPQEEAACPIGVQGPLQNGAFTERAYRPLDQVRDEDCDFAAVASALQMRVHSRGCLRVTPGWYSVRVPVRFAHDASLRLVLCKTEHDGTTSCGMGVEPPEYHAQRDRKEVAIVWNSEAEARASSVRTNLWFRFEDCPQ